MIVTMLGVTWKIRSWKTGKVPFRPLFVYKSQTWDRAISNTEQLLANSQQQKKALMQQLLTGKIRLPLAAGA